MSLLVPYSLSIGWMVMMKNAFAAIAGFAVLLLSQSALAQLSSVFALDQVLPMLRTSYTARDLHLSGAVKRVVLYDTTGLAALGGNEERLFLPDVPIPDSISNFIPHGTWDSINRVREIIRQARKGVWEFDREGNIVREEYHSPFTLYHRNNEGLIDSMTTYQSYLLKRYNAAGALTGMQLNLQQATGTKPDGHVLYEPQEWMRAEILRGATGEINLILLYQSYYGTAPLAIYAEQGERGDDGAYSTTFTAHDRYGDYTVRYYLNARGHLNVVHLTSATKENNGAPLEDKMLLDEDGNVLLREARYPFKEFTRKFYQYNKRGEMTLYSYTSNHRTIHEIEPDTVFHYSYTYDDHGNWIVRTNGNLPNPSIELPHEPLPEEWVPYLKRYIEYW